MSYLRWETFDVRIFTWTPILISTSFKFAFWTLSQYLWIGKIASHP